jgi:hypothetical protein
MLTKSKGAVSCVNKIMLISSAKNLLFNKNDEKKYVKGIPIHVVESIFSFDG